MQTLTREQCKKITLALRNYVKHCSPADIPEVEEVRKLLEKAGVDFCGMKFTPNLYFYRSKEQIDP